MMKELGIQGRIKRRYITTTNSRHNNRIYSNLIKDKELTGINQVWCADITYIRILNGFVYLAAIIDICSRKIVGYAIGKTLSSELAITALNMAIATRKTDNLIHHSDRGIQYTCKDYIKILKDNGIRISMSAKGNPFNHKGKLRIRGQFKTMMYACSMGISINFGRIHRYLTVNPSLCDLLGLMKADNRLFFKNLFQVAQEIAQYFSFRLFYGQIPPIAQF